MVCDKEINVSANVFTLFTMFVICFNFTHCILQCRFCYLCVCLRLSVLLIYVSCVSRVAMCTVCVPLLLICFIIIIIIFIIIIFIIIIFIIIIFIIIIFIIFIIIIYYYLLFYLTKIIDIQYNAIQCYFFETTNRL